MSGFVVRLDISGQRFGRLIALEYAETRKKVAFWRFRCDCGSEKIINGSNVRLGKTTSCGCRHRARAVEANTKHGSYGSPEHVVWSGMKARCFNDQHAAYHRYGGRGIKVCDRWLDFSAFISDMGPRPSPKHTIERLDNDKGYQPGNCVWLASTKQS